MSLKPAFRAAMSLDLPQALPSLVEARYKSCQAASKLRFTPSDVTILHTKSGLPFQLRYCPSLAKKPISKDTQANKSNPFENPDRDMIIAEIPPSNPTHCLILNKFPIIPNHFMLITKNYKEQTERLEQNDIQAVYACLQNWSEQEPNDRKRELFAFFNSGEHSGASQTHRHVQFIPVESMIADIPGQKFELLLSKLTTESRDMPFTYFWSPIPLKPSPAQLHQIYSKLYDAAAAAVRDYNKSSLGKLETHDSKDGNFTFSYNLGMTTSAMVIYPRRSEGMPLKRDDGSDVGFVALNGTLLAGSMMVKNQEAWNFLRSRPGILDDILGTIGIPPEAVEYHSGAKI